VGTSACYLVYTQLTTWHDLCSPTTHRQLPTRAQLVDELARVLAHHPQVPPSVKGPGPRHVLNPVQASGAGAADLQVVQVTAVSSPLSLPQATAKHEVHVALLPTKTMATR
jgi:hypothetical protein